MDPFVKLLPAKKKEEEEPVTVSREVEKEVKEKKVKP